MTTTEREPAKLGTTSWADLGGRGIDPRRPLAGGWLAQHDLAVEAFDTTRAYCPGLTFENFRALVSAAASGLPIELVWRNRAGEVTRSFVVIRQWVTLAHCTANLHVKRWGFSHPIALHELVSVEVPEASYDYLGVDNNEDNA